MMDTCCSISKIKVFLYLGIEPTKNTANVAVLKGIPTITEYFGSAFARQSKEQAQKGDLLVGNNVLAHVPDIN